MSPPVKIEALTREQIANFLPEAIRLAVGSYRSFMQSEEVASTRKDFKKDFVEHHKSAKIAISHIELLIKLARWADLPDTGLAGKSEADILAGLMAAAEAEIMAYQDDDEDHPDSLSPSD